MIIVILIAVTFAGAYGIVMFYNIAINTKAFAEIPGLEIGNAIAILNPENDQSKTIETIRSIDNVRKAQFLDEVKMSVDNTEVLVYIMNDYAEKETRLIYNGYYPEAENEISLSGLFAERIEKKVGDTIQLSYDNHVETFAIVGLSNGDAAAFILTKDYLHYKPNFQQQILYIYLDKDTDTKGFIEKLDEQFDKSAILTKINFDEAMIEGMASYQGVITVMGVAMLAITLLVVSLVLYFMISFSIVRQKRELGIQKAIGYTTVQLMNQIAVNFMIPIIIGATIGSLLGAFGTNPLMSVVMKSAGFIVDPLWIVAFGIGTIIFSYLLSLFITWRIRKISAYALVTE